MKILQHTVIQIIIIKKKDTIVHTILNNILYYYFVNEMEKRGVSLHHHLDHSEALKGARLMVEDSGIPVMGHCVHKSMYMCSYK